MEKAQQAGAAAERAALVKGVAALGLQVAPGAVDRLLAYAAELRRWNRRYNLVSASDMPALVGRHLLDCLAVLRWAGSGRLLDIGSGAGLPGMVFAIARPELGCTLLDSAGKKTRFLAHVARSLPVANATVVQCRVEDFQAEAAFDTICCRAYASLAQFAAASRHLAGPGTRLLAMKGRRPDEELEGLPGWVGVDSVEAVSVPDLRAERHIVIMSIPNAPGR